MFIFTLIFIPPALSNKILATLIVLHLSVTKRSKHKQQLVNNRQHVVLILMETITFYYK